MVATAAAGGMAAAGGTAGVGGTAAARGRRRRKEGVRKVRARNGGRDDGATAAETVAPRTPAVAVATEAPVSTSRRTMRTEEDERGGRGRAAPTALACMRRAQGVWRGRANGEARGLARGGAMRDGWARQGAVLARRRRWRTSWSSWHRRGAATRPHSTQLLEVLGGEASDEARVVGEAAPAAAWAASAKLDSHSKRNGRCENCLPNSLLQQRMLAHTMDRCVLAVEHSFGCGTMRMHWKL